MKRRNFFKKIAGVIAGLVIAPIVIEAKETQQADETGFFIAQRDENGLINWKNGDVNQKTSYFQKKHIPNQVFKI